MVNGSSSVMISGAAYSAADTMTLTATAVSGLSLTAAVSPPITFMPPDLTWDANGTGAGVRDGGGVWINSTNTWWNGTTNLNWADNYNARIGAGGAGGTITLDTVTANLVTFSNFSGTYTLTSGSLMVVSNMTVANSAGSVVLGYIIGGPGGVTMDSPGSLRLYGLSPNAYSGGTIINRGTLIWGTMVSGISPECNYALGTGPVTLNSGATLQFERVNATVLGIYWALSGRGFPYTSETVSDSSGSMLGRFGPGVAWIVVMLAGIPAAAVGVAMLRGVRGRVLRPLLITAGALLAGVLLLLMIEFTLLIQLAYIPFVVYNLLTGAEFGQVFLEGLAQSKWTIAHQLLCLTGGFLWLAATLNYARRSGDACLYCGRGDSPEGWNSPEHAARWGRMAVYVVPPEEAPGVAHGKDHDGEDEERA